MKEYRTRSKSIGRQFARDYLLISILPLAVLFVLGLAGALIVENTIGSLIARSMQQLNDETHLHPYRRILGPHSSHRWPGIGNSQTRLRRLYPEALQP